jgi:hypothetical protein
MLRETSVRLRKTSVRLRKTCQVKKNLSQSKKNFSQFTSLLNSHLSARKEKIIEIVGSEKQLWIRKGLCFVHIMFKKIKHSKFLTF